MDDDDDERENYDYRPLHPFREGITIGMCTMLVAAILFWLALKVFG